MYFKPLGSTLIAGKDLWVLLNGDGTTGDGLNDDDIDPPKPFNGFISDDDDNTLALIDKFNINDNKKNIIIIIINNDTINKWNN